MDCDTIIYRLDHLVKCSNVQTNKFEHKIWKPDILHLVPPFFPKKYIFYSIRRLLRGFKSTIFFASYIYHDNQLAARLLVVPKHFKWSFMGSSDVQLIYVITSEKMRGKGLGSKNLELAINTAKKFHVNNIWYVTNESNIASKKLAKKNGFVLEGSGIYRRNIFGISQLQLSEKLKT